MGAWQELVSKQSQGLHLNSPLLASTITVTTIRHLKQNNYHRVKSKPRSMSTVLHTLTALQVFYLRWKASINVRAVKTVAVKSNGREKRAGKTRRRFIQMGTSDVTTWEFSCYFGEAFVVKCALSLLLLVLTGQRHSRWLTDWLTDCCAACARSRDTVKPERRWCHGPDVKQAWWPVALLIFPPSKQGMYTNSQTERLSRYSLVIKDCFPFLSRIYYLRPGFWGVKFKTL